MRKSIILFLIASICLSLSAQTKISGRVISDGKGIANVVVTDGYTCIKTDKNGKYSFIKDNDAVFVYISTPAGYTVENKQNTLPIFYQRVEAEKVKYDFNILRNPKSDDKHTFYVQTDVQVAYPDEVEMYQPIVEDARDYMKQYSANDVFGLDCGDIVGDHPELYPNYIEKSSMLGFPIYRAMGNHDMKYNGRTFETSVSQFQDVFGPSYYSFNKGKAHYIVVNNNFYFGVPYNYIGYIDETTYRWIENDLKGVPEGSLVVVSMHIPTQLTSKYSQFEYKYSKMGEIMINYHALHKMLGKYNGHIISGHTHNNNNMIYNENLMEHNTAATSGTWWQLDGCVDGTPCGYGVYEVDGNNIKWHYKSAYKPASFQLRAYAPNSMKEHPQDVIANVWNHDPMWKVELVEDGVVTGIMTQFTGLDPHVRVNCKDTSKMRYNWISASPTNHIFHATPKNPNAKLSVKVTDRFGNVYTEEASKDYEIN